MEQQTVKDTPLPVQAEPETTDSAATGSGPSRGTGAPPVPLETYQEYVAVAAYYLYQARLEAQQPGDAVGDWATAEVEIDQMFEGEGLN